MAKVIVDNANKLGYGVMVENLNPRFGEALWYHEFHLKLADAVVIDNGIVLDAAICYMFTDGEFRSFFYTPYTQPTGGTSLIANFPGAVGTLYHGFINGRVCFVGKLNWLGECRTVKISKSLIIKALKRAKNNPEDIKKQPLLRRIFG